MLAQNADVNAEDEDEARITPLMQVCIVRFALCVVCVCVSVYLCEERPSCKFGSSGTLASILHVFLCSPGSAADAERCMLAL